MYAFDLLHLICGVYTTACYNYFTRVGQPAKLLETWGGEKVVILINGELGKAQENTARPLHRRVLVWVPGLCSQCPMFMPDTLGNDLFVVAEISETASFIEILIMMMIMCSIAQNFEH